MRNSTLISQGLLSPLFPPLAARTESYSASLSSEKAYLPEQGPFDADAGANHERHEDVVQSHQEHPPDDRVRLGVARRENVDERDARLQAGDR